MILDNFNTILVRGIEGHKGKEDGGMEGEGGRGRGREGRGREGE